MKNFIKLNIYILPLTILLSSLSRLPNKISIALILLSLILNSEKELIKYITQNKFILITIVIFIGLLTFNNVLLTDFLLFLSYPVIFYIYKYSNINKRDSLKKYFCYSNVIFIFIVLISKFFTLYKTGFDHFLNDGYWWNKIIYLSLVEPVGGHPTYISLFILVSLIFVLNQVVIERWFFSKTISIIIFSFQLFFLILLSVKIAFISIVFLLVLFLFWVMQHRNSKLLIASSLTLILLAFILIISLPSIKYRLKHDFQQIQNSDNLYDTNSKFSERLALWKSSIDLIIENPFIGTSMRNINSKDAIFEKVMQINSFSNTPKNSHNNFLEFGVRYGLLGFLIFFVLCVSVIYFGLKHYSFFITSISSVFILFSLTESFLFREMGVMLLAITIGISYKEIKNERGI